MNYFDALILGVVEGLTEFLPVSSTGHLILTNTLLGIEGKAADVYTIVIQLGAILAVLALYKDRALEMLFGLMGKNSAGLQLFLKLIVAFIPAVIFGLLFEDLIDAYLFSPIPVASALLIGGIAMIAVERLIVKPKENAGDGLKEIADLTYLDAILIGLAQCLALWPGTSRSMSTILGAQLRGFSSAAAAELSFLLALPTLGGATVYKLISNREELMNMPNGLVLILFGNVIAFVVALLAVKWFVAIVKKSGMVPFGIYRIVIGAIFLALALMGYLSFAPEP